MAETNRILAKAERALYAGKEDFASSSDCKVDEFGFRHGFKEETAWRTFPHPEIPTPMQGAAIKLAGPNGDGRPQVTPSVIALNGACPEDYESFHLERAPECPEYQRERAKTEGVFNFCKTEYRPYDPVVVSILHVARTVAPDAITVKSDGGDEAIKLMF